MTLINPNPYLQGCNKLPSGAIPIATDQPGSVIAQTAHGRWIRWWPGTRSIESVPIAAQKEVVAALCVELGGTAATAQALEVSPRTIESWRAGRATMPAKAVEKAAQAIA